MNMDHTMMQSESMPEMQQCIQNCSDCHRICLATVPHCLRMGGDHASPGHITTLLQCAKLCETSADMMLLNAPLHTQVCNVCAQACERCADECERMAEGDQQMLDCAAACRRCAESCRSMAALPA